MKFSIILTSKWIIHLYFETNFKIPLMILKNKLLLMLLCICTFTFTSCSTDDEIPVPNVIRTGTFTVQDQVLQGDKLTISNVDVTQQSWIVLHRDNGSGGPVVPEIISKPKLLKKGESTNVTIQLKAGVEIEDGETIWAMLHKDTNRLGEYEFDGESGIDVPITNDAGEIVMDAFTVTVLPEPTGSLTVEDQALVNNTLTVASITLDQDGYVVVHADNGSNAPVVPAIISEPKYLEAGTHTDVEIMIKESADVMEGDKLWIMLHTDTGAEEVYEFNGTNGLDKPILDDAGKIVMDSIMITEVIKDATGSLTVNDQILTNHNVTIASITMGQSGYVVIHADNGSNAPVVPEIISQPVYLEEGTYEDVVVPLKETANVDEGDKLWAMLHADTGTEEVYEFDGQNGLDLPIIMDGNIVMESFMITAVEMVAITGTLTVEDQALVDNTITVGPITLSEDGWVVVHASNSAMTGPMVPEIISIPVYLEAGTHTDVEITFEDSANLDVGDTVYVMLHDDTGVDAVYEFDGMNGLDLPIVVDGAVVVKPLVITE